MRLRLLALAAICAVTVSACGGSDNGDRDGARTARTTPGRPAPAVPGLPRGVPQRSTSAADPAQAKVIRAWTDALRSGDIEAASALWAVPSKVQNGTPLVSLRSRAAVALFQSSLPCGAQVTATAGAPRDFTIVTVRLTERRGANCGSGAGVSARTAIRVLDGKITEWYRLPDDPDAPSPRRSPEPTDGGADETTI